MKLKYLGLILLACALTGCDKISTIFGPQDGPPNHYVDVTKIKNPKPKKLTKSRYGNPVEYTTLGETYHTLKTAKNYHKTGIASWYGTKFNGKLTSTREVYDMYKMTAAHKTLPIPCYAKVTDLENGRQIVVKINDRGPFEKNRIIDLSYVAAKKLGIIATGTGLVRIDTISPSQKNIKLAAHNPDVPLEKTPHIYLQVGAYSNPDYAKQVEHAVNQTISEPSHILLAKKRNNSLYRVQIGPIKTVALADRITANLEQAGLPEPVTVIR